MAKAQVVELDGKKFVATLDKEGGPVILPFGTDFNTFIPCPPIMGDECPHGYDEECQGGEIWCILNGPG